MRLDREDVKDIKEALICDKDRRPLSYTCCIELFETIEGLYGDVDSLMEQLNRNIFAMDDAEAKIEALQQENEQLKDENASLRNWNACEEELHNELLESDKRRWELESELEDANNYRAGLEAIVDKLRVRVARMREALEYYADIKRWSEVNLIYVPSPDKARKALSDTPADYHNPADVEALRKAREALIDYKTFLESFQCTCEPSNETYPGVCCERCCRLNQAKQTLAEIDKAIGGKECAE